MPRWAHDLREEIAMYASADDMIRAAQAAGKAEQVFADGSRLVCYWGERNTNPGSGKLTTGAVWRFRAKGQNYRSCKRTEADRLIREAQQ